MSMNSKSEAESARQVATGLVRACATTVASTERSSLIRQLAGECRDWEYFTQACKDHHVSSLVCHTLVAHAADLIPTAVRELLHARFRANACRNLFLTQELLQLIQKFRQQGIEVIPFKGPLLAVTAYGNLALREFVDLDILVPKDNFNGARTLMKGWGYHAPGGDDARLEASYFESQLGSDHVREDGKVTLELHWSFIQTWLGFNVDIQTVWVLSRPFLLGSVPVLNLPADITLIYLCAHGAKHRWSRLCWLVDIAEVLRRRSDLNWDALLTQATRSGCLRTLFIGLKLAQTLLGAAIPDRVVACIEQDKQAVALAQSLALQMFAPGKNYFHQHFGWGWDWYHICTKERWREKVMYLGQLAIWYMEPNDKDRAWITLPRGLHWLYPVIRPVRVACQSRQSTVDTL
jgi:hypothetical protein